MIKPEKRCFSLFHKKRSPLPSPDHAPPFTGLGHKWSTLCPSSSTDGRSQGTVGRQMVGFRNAWRQIRVWTVLLGAAGLAPAGHGTVLSRPGSRCRFLSQCRCLTLCLGAPSLLVRRPNHRHTTKPRLTLQLKTYAGTKSFHCHTASCTKDRTLHSICSLRST